MSTNNPPNLPPLPSGEQPHPNKEPEDDSYTDEQLLRDLLQIVLSADFPSEGDLSFNSEIVALKESISHLQESFSDVVDLNEQLKLSAAISHLASSLSKLVRAQEFLRKTRPSVMNQAMEAAIQDVLREWGWT